MKPLILLLLIAMSDGTVWAAEPNDGRWCFNESTNDVYPCVEQPAQGICRGPQKITLKQWQEKQLCYARMREAMLAVSPYIVDIYKPFYLDYTHAAQTLAHNQRAVQRWDLVMTDCVRDRP